MKTMMTMTLLMQISLFPIYGKAIPKVLYGNDDRVEVQNFGLKAFREKAKSVAMRVESYKLIESFQNDSSGAYSLTDEAEVARLNKLLSLYSDYPYLLTYLEGELGAIRRKYVTTLDHTDQEDFAIFDFDQSNDFGRMVCREERFSNQIILGACTGFLVGEDLLVTAGHCIKSIEDCNDNTWVFDYVEGVTKIKKSNTYRCAEIVSQRYSVSFLRGTNDFAVIRLDRKTGRKPLKFRKSGRIKKNTEVIVIGHPMGLPMKIADNAYVRSTFGRTFKADLDTYGGNSGSPVFNKKTGLVEGILVQGAEDFVLENGCRRSNRLKGKNEIVYKINKIEVLKNLK